MIGFGADGASVNLGKRQGVAAILEREIFHLVDIHCVQFQQNELILPCAVFLLEETVSNIIRLSKRPVPGGRLHTFMSSFQACNGPFMFQGIILSGDASGLTPVEITHTNGVGAQIKRATDLCLSGLKQRLDVILHQQNCTGTLWFKPSF